MDLPLELRSRIFLEAIFEKQGEASFPSLMSKVPCTMTCSQLRGHSEVWMNLRLMCKKLNTYISKLPLAPPRIFRRGCFGFDEDGSPMPPLTRKPEDAGTLQFPVCASYWTWTVIGLDAQRVGEKFALIRDVLTPISCLPQDTYGVFYCYVRPIEKVNGVIDSSLLDEAYDKAERLKHHCRRDVEKNHTHRFAGTEGGAHIVCGGCQGERRA